MSQYLSIDIQDVKKAGIKLALVLLGALATFLETDLFNIVHIEGVGYVIALAFNTAIIDLIRKFITDNEGRIAGIKL